MSLEAIIGQESTFDVEFLTSEDVPVDPVSSPKYKIVSHLGEFVLEGFGIQDDGAPERWFAMATIPSGAAPTNSPGEFYKIIWTITSRSGIRYSNRENFKVYADLNQDLEPIEAVFGLQGDTEVEDTIITDEPLVSASYQLIDPFVIDQPFTKIDIASPVAAQTDRGRFFYKQAIDVSGIELRHMDVLEQQISWELTFGNNRREREIHPLYMTSYFVLKMVADVRQKIDKGQQWHLNQSLNISDWEIIFCLMQAMDKINMAQPQVTEWTVGTLPSQLRYFLTNFAAVELLDQLYLAHGLSAFDFQGQSTQLSMDLTQYIQSAKDTMNQELLERLPIAKKLYIRQSRSIGVLSVQVGPSTNFPSYASPSSHLLYRLRGFLFRGF